MGSIAPRIHVATQIFDDGDMSGDITSTVLDLTAFRHLAIQAVWAGVPVGNLQLQVSNDGSTWTDQGSPVAGGGGAGSTMITEQFAPWAQARLFWDFTSGTGTLQAYAIIKE